MVHVYSITRLHLPRLTYFSSLSNTYDCSGGLKIIALPCLDNQTASRESPYIKLVRLDINLATFCDKWNSMDTIWLFWHLAPRVARHFVATRHPYRSACGID